MVLYLSTISGRDKRNGEECRLIESVLLFRKTGPYQSYGLSEIRNVISKDFCVKFLTAFIQICKSLVFQIMKIQKCVLFYLRKWISFDS